MARIVDTADLTPESIAAMSYDERYWTYNGLDITVTEEVRQGLRPMLDNTTTATYEFSKSLMAPVLDMSMRGILVNQNKRMKIIRKFEGHQRQLQEQLHAIIHDGIGWEGDFNPASPTQVARLLYGVMELPKQFKRNTNGDRVPSTGREALETLSSYFIAEPICLHLLGLRDLGKALGFLRTGIDPDGRIRTGINIAGTNTGRFSSAVSDYGTGTNLQNVARDLRSIFVADPGHKFGNLDLEQADARNLGALIWQLCYSKRGAEFAGRYLDACEAGDLHTRVCKLCNPQLPWDQGQTDRQVADQLFYRDKTYRDGAKVLGHGTNFLGTPVTMAKHTKFPVNLVKQFQASYFSAFPSVPLYHQYVSNELREYHSLTTLFNRRRVFYGRADDMATLREAVAFSPQSMTADEINTGIMNMWRSDYARKAQVQLLMQVHDSILFQYPEAMEDEIIPWALETLKAPLELAGGRHFVVPTEAKVGWNWADQPKDASLNPDGLVKWKGHDSRTRTETRFKLDIMEQ